MYNLYNIPTKNENQNTIIPFSLSKGIPELKHNEIGVLITFKEYTNQTISKIEYKVQYAKEIIPDMVVHQIKQSYANFNTSSKTFKLNLNHPIGYFFTKSNKDDEDLKLLINGNYELSIPKCYELSNSEFDCFPLTNKLTNYKNYINFSKIDIVSSNKQVYYYLNTNIIKFMSGMAGLKFCG